MIALNAVVAPLLVNMRDAVEMRIVAVVPILDDLATSRRLIGADDVWSIKTDAPNGLSQKGFGCFCVARRCQPEVDEPTRFGRGHATSNAISCRRERTFHQRANLGHASFCNCRRVLRSRARTLESSGTPSPDLQRSLARRKVPDIGVGRGKPTISADGEKDDFSRILVALERIAAHDSIPVPIQTTPSSAYLPAMSGR